MFKIQMAALPGIHRMTSLLHKFMLGVSCLVMLALLTPLAHADEEFLAPEVAFKFSARMDDAQTIAVTYAIADGYYMYRERFAFRANGATLGEPQIPDGKIKFDETFQKDVETFRNSVTIRIPVEASAPFTLISTSQGCSDKGLCYSPMDTEARFSVGDGKVTLLSSSVAGVTAQAGSALPQTEMGRIESSLKSGNLLTILPLFFLLGLGLAFTPCVLPMVPILSSIIVGEGTQVKRSRGFVLALVYSLGMAIVYTLLGTAAGLVGEGLAAALQNPWVLGTFAVLMAVLALAMFDVYQLQMPAAIQTRLTQASEKQSAGKLIGVFVMGALSALIVGPCVAAPLAGALVYISQTRDVMIGGSALFAMAIGMSVPLLLVGLSAGALLPRAGMWMDAVKRFFGVLMLAVALWMVSPVIPAVAQMLGWTALFVGYGAYLLWDAKGGWFSKAVGLVCVVLGMLQLVGVATGGRDALAPLEHLQGERQQKVTFKRVKTVADLDAALAQSQGKHVMLDFYADWCVSCIEMEKLTFTDQRVRAHFADMVLLQVDVTANDAEDKAMLRRFNLFGPPGIIFFDKAGQEIQGGRVIGFQNADKFTQSLDLIKQF
ncbi:protein-disulfide reductase DsbD [Herminiimonas sp. KBW02]|uniref:protein-disulfide reductase DsbD n=1 Tax=Herminiimonas sp. KBW02 TaxID=2153363 RepID=UPI000F598EF3|nr:protein-disulfide reductase DsbD [Herminiimonas sp. KBW02]RQO34619.1 protein-disulfide reductase DsbD [Herminiimonas sp. KBW02]